MTAGQQIDYELLAQDAMRGVVREVLRRVAESGLPGDHHFYIAFNMRAPGVSVSKRLREKYPEEMTIVLQHRFWDLVVENERFEVKLTFEAIPERLCIPFKAIKVFLDPSVQYGLQFGESEAPEERAERASETAAGQLAAAADRPASEVEPAAHAPPRPAPERRRAPRKPRAEKTAEPRTSEPAATPTTAPRVRQVETPAPLEGKSAAAGPDTATVPAPAATPAPAADGAKIVRLDVFRNKTK